MSFIKCMIIVLLKICLLSLLCYATDYYVSPSGSDSNPGTSSQPFLTIQKAADVAQPGDTIIVREGTYRERVTPPRGGTSESARIIYKAADGETVAIKGSEVWTPAWQNSTGNIFYAQPDSSLFTDDAYDDMKTNPFEVPLGYWDTIYEPFEGPRTCGQVFVDGKRYNERLSAVVSLTPETWYFSSGNIYVHFPDGDPQNHTVEITCRRSIFRPHIKGLNYITVKGFIVEHCGNQIHSWPGTVGFHDPHAGIDGRGGHHLIIENNTIRHMKSTAIDAGGYGYPDNERDEQGSYHPSYNIVKNNIIVDNGYTGITSSLRADGSGTANQIIGNYIARNNYLRLYSPESAGFKAHQFHDSIIADNIVIDNNTWGIWLDWSWCNTRITRNLVCNNGGPDGNYSDGIFLEACAPPSGEELLIDNNIIMNSKGCGIAVFAANGYHIINNIFINNGNRPIGVSCGGDRNVPGGRGTGNMTTATCKNMQFYHNIYIDNTFAFEYAQDAVNTSGDYNIFNQAHELTIVQNQGYDANSVVGNITYSFSPESSILDLTVDGTPWQVMTTKFSSELTEDYFMNPMPSVVLPGPFQTLQQGNNLYSLMKIQGIALTSISVSKTTLDFEEVEIGKTKTLDFRIANTGGGVLSGSISTDEPWIEVTPTSFLGNNITVNVTVDNNILNKSEGEHTGTISITSNGGNIDVAVQLAATCVLVKPNPYNPDEGPLTFFGDGIVPGETTIKIYTLSGELVSTVIVSDSESISWNGKNEEGKMVTNGIYIYVYESPKEKGMGKFTVIR